eukprot:TRINITY_DN1903_c0_g2_i1.p2 TRINITY_DN1903_c0_g2~~TRINITY_DN1903_c0_g2_i1.p2  ORF type:complete len:472 (+),score=102.77 TRINITY_DN1903_c0_g2_i1:124-1539(+)
MTVCRIAIVGAGPLVGQAHCKIIKDMAVEGVELACICQRRPDDERLSDLYQVPLYTDAFEMARKEQLHGVVIAAPTHVHLPIAKAVVEGAAARKQDLGEEAAAEKGLRALLVEKPICQDLESAVKLLNITEAADVVVLVGHQRRHSAYVRRARELVTDKNFGPLRGVTMEFSLLKPDSYFNADSPAVEWRRKKGIGGPILINTIHDLDLMRYITGHEITQVFAMTSSSARDNEVEDSGAVALTFDHGAVGTLFFTDSAPAPWSYEFTTGENKKYPPVADTETRDCYHFMGHQRSLGFPSMRGFSYSPGAGQERGWDCPLILEEDAVLREDPLNAQMEHFVEVCNGGVKPVCGGRDAVESLAVVMAVLRSAEQGRPVAPAEMLMEVNQAVMTSGIPLLPSTDSKGADALSKLSQKATSLPTCTKKDTTQASETADVESKQRMSSVGGNALKKVHSKLSVGSFGYADSKHAVV